MSEPRFQKACQELVERGRLGDQNALATMVEVRKNATKGVPLAKRAHETMLRYARLTESDRPGAPSRVSGGFSSALAMLRDGMRHARHPLEYVKAIRLGVPQVGPTLKDAANSAQALSKGPDISEETLQATENTFTTDVAKQAYKIGYDASGDPRLLKQVLGESRDEQTKNAIQMGFVLGLAHRMQIVRKGGPIALYSKIAAWELGEI